MTSPYNLTGVALYVQPGGAIMLRAQFQTAVGSGISQPVSGVTITITPSAGGSPVVGPTSAGVIAADAATYTYTWSVAAAIPPGDYTVVWQAATPSLSLSGVVTVVRQPDESPSPGVYASVDQYRAWSGDWGTPNTRLAVDLRRASEVIDVALVGAVYQTDADGMPVAPMVIDCFMRATCAQTQYVIANNDPANVKDQYLNSNVGGVALTRAPGTMAKALPPLAPQAAAILRVAGVLPAAPLVSW